MIMYPLKQSTRRPFARALTLAGALAGAACGEEPAPPGSSAAANASSTSSAGAAGAAGAAPTAAAAPEGRITLITGDVVTLRKTSSGATERRVDPAPGREHLAFSLQERGGELSVIPADMLPLIAAGQLDPQLFDVTRLLADGHGDDRRRDIPLLVTGLPTTSSSARGAQLLQAASQLVTDAGLTVQRQLPTVRAIALRQRKADAGAATTALRALREAALAAPSGKAGPAAVLPKLWLDGRRELSLDESVVQIGAPAAYGRGLTGTGVVVAVLDTGIDATHPDLLGKVAAAETFIDDGEGVGDVFGHGTHVASIVAGSGAASAGQLHGVAPGATLLSGRVCDVAGGCYDSAILAGMEWAIAHDARIINLSLGATDSPGIDPLEEAINRLSAEHGTLFVAAAGNNGFSASSVDSPSSADAALSVGAVDRFDSRASFSGQGPRTGDHALKPDLTAPGTDIVAARADGTLIGAPVGDFYVRLSGTSMATPHAAGAAALLFQQHPEWNGQQVKAALMGTAATATATNVYEYGAGRLDADRATGQALIAEPPSLSLGLATYPHDDDQPITRVLRYRNRGAAPLTLALTASLTHSSSGAPAPAEMIAIAPAAITVAPGGEAEVTVTADTRAAAADGLYGGAVIAEGSGARLITPLGVEREIEAYDLTIVVRGPDGQPGDAFVSLLGAAPRGTPAGEVALFREPVIGQATFHLPVGTYVIDALDSANAIWTLAPRLPLTADATVVMDGQLARPTALTLPEPGMALRFASWIFMDRQFARGSFLFAGEMFATAEIGPSAPAGAIFSAAFAAFTAFTENGSNPSVIYNLARRQDDHFLTGWEQTFRRHELATVHADHAGEEGSLFEEVSGVVFRDALLAIGFGSAAQAAPLQRTEHYYGPGLSWQSSTNQVLEQGGYPVFWEEAVRDYRAGRSSREAWNQAPYGPAFADGTLAAVLGDFTHSPRRSGDILVLNPTMFAGQSDPAHNTYSQIDAGRLTLSRDGEVLGEVPDPDFGLFTQVEPGPAVYRLEAEATRPAELFELSRHVAATWTFSSQHVSDATTILPLPTLRFSPPLDLHNRTSARVMPLPIRIERPAGGPTPRITEARVEISFDDGATWARLPLVRLGDQALALVVHPRGATRVSLRGSARDIAGNSVEQTILRAYALTQ